MLLDLAVSDNSRPCGHRGRTAPPADRPGRSQEPDRGELNGEPEPRVVFAQLINDAAITVVEVKVRTQLCARRLAGIAAIAALLVGGQEIDGKAPRRQPLKARRKLRILCDKSPL